MDFWDSYEKPKAKKKTKQATKQLANGVNTKQNNPETASISINISLPITTPCIPAVCSFAEHGRLSKFSGTFINDKICFLFIKLKSF